MIRIILYLLGITAANVVTATFAPVAFGPFFVPFGTFFIGFTFILRDLVQNKFGRKKTYSIIVAALILSAIVSAFLGDTLWVVFASAVSFIFSESMDTEVYTRLKKPMYVRIFVSGLFGGTIDSSIFVLIGLSPLGMGVLTWDQVPNAIIGQIIVKTVLQGIGALVVYAIHKHKGIEYDPNEVMID